MRAGLRSLPRTGFYNPSRQPAPTRCIFCPLTLSLANTGIRLAGATSDVHIMNVRTGKWDRATPAGEAPSPRAAHAAAAVGSMVVVQVGSLPASDLPRNRPT